jgi:hypothetical protein
MKRILFCAWMLFIFPMSSLAGDKDVSHVQEYFDTLVVKIQQHVIKGPMAEEVAKYAIIRQLHEDGDNKPKGYSVPGLSFGHPIKGIVNCTDLEGCVTSSANDSDGVPMYVFKGENAVVISGVLITKVFDHFVMNMNLFKEKDIEIWDRSKKDSYLLANRIDLDEYRVRFNENKSERDKIIRRCNQLYGPAGNSIEQRIKKIWQQ